MKSTTVVNETHERRFEPMKRQMHQIYDATFRNTPVEDVNMVVGSRNQKDARNDLIRKRPNRALLQDTPRKGMYSILILLWLTDFHAIFVLLINASRTTTTTLTDRVPNHSESTSHPLLRTINNSRILSTFVTMIVRFVYLFNS